MSTSESRFYPIAITFPPLDRLGFAGAHLALSALQSHQIPSMSSDPACREALSSTANSASLPPLTSARQSTPLSLYHIDNLSKAFITNCID